MSPTRFSFHDLLRGDLSIPGDHLEDAVLLKSDGYPTYHLASVVDDHFMQISLVIRGEEWISSVPKHLQLYKAFGWKPPDFIHLPLLLSEQKSKISKRQGGFDAQSILQEGVLPSALLNYIYYLGLKRGNDETQQENGVFFDLNEMIRDVAPSIHRFSLSSHSPNSARRPRASIRNSFATSISCTFNTRSTQTPINSFNTPSPSSIHPSFLANSRGKSSSNSRGCDSVSTFHLVAADSSVKGC